MVIIYFTVATSLSVPAKCDSLCITFHLNSLRLPVETSPDRLLQSACLLAPPDWLSSPVRCIQAPSSSKSPKCSTSFWKAAQPGSSQQLSAPWCPAVLVTLLLQCYGSLTSSEVCMHPMELQANIYSKNHTHSCLFYHSNRKAKKTPANQGLRPSGQ